MNQTKYDADLTAWMIHIVDSGMVASEAEPAFRAFAELEVPSEPCWEAFTRLVNEYIK
jgi:hypothetical protein